MTDVRLCRCSSAEDTLVCRPVHGPDELAAHLLIRRRVFVAEQRLFAVDDRDGHDADPVTVHVLGFARGEPAGTVRLYPLGEGRWKGDRLAVLPEQRRTRIGGPLVRQAVALAGARGGTRMDAVVQVANVPFFTQLGWSRAGRPTDYLGVQHQPMTIPLARPLNAPQASGSPAEQR